MRLRAIAATRLLFIHEFHPGSAGFKHGDHARDDAILSADLIGKMGFELAGMFEAFARNGVWIHSSELRSVRGARSLSWWSSVRFATR